MSDRRCTVCGGTPSRPYRQPCAAYGDFSPSTRFEDLAAAIAGLGCSVEPEPDEDGTAGGIRRYRVTESGVRIFVRADENAQGQAGVVWSLSVSPTWWSEAG
jgi:hypothetical protein